MKTTDLLLLAAIGVGAYLIATRNALSVPQTTPPAPPTTPTAKPPDPLGGFGGFLSAGADILKQGEDLFGKLFG